VRPPKVRTPAGLDSKKAFESVFRAPELGTKFEEKGRSGGYETGQIINFSGTPMESDLHDRPLSTGPDREYWESLESSSRWIRKRDHNLKAFNCRDGRQIPEIPFNSIKNQNVRSNHRSRVSSTPPSL